MIEKIMTPATESVILNANDGCETFGPGCGPVIFVNAWAPTFSVLRSAMTDPRLVVRSTASEYENEPDKTAISKNINIMPDIPKAQ